MASSNGPGVGNELPCHMSVEVSDSPLSIAIVYGRLPFPMIRGDQRTIANLIAFLAARGHAVDFYTLDLHGEHTPAQEEFVQTACRNVRVYHQSKLRSLMGVLTALLRGIPAQIGFFQNPQLNKDLQANIDAGKYDIVYAYYLRSAPAVQNRFAPNATVERNGRRLGAFLAMQLSQTLNWDRLVERCTSFWRKPLYRIEANLIRRYESTIWRKFTKVLLIGPKDVEAVQDACIRSNQPVLNNWLYGAHGTDVRSFRPASSSEVIRNRIVFSGNMGYRPNVEAALWFLTKCWPTIKSKRPDAEVYFVGWRPAEEILSLAATDSSITVTGAVADVGEYIRSAQVCINSVLAAAGMQNKLIEYLASQRPVVATTAANEGVLAPPDTLIIADDSVEFAQKVIDCLQNPEEAESMARRGRKFVENEWTWEAHFMKLEDNFRQVLATSDHSQRQTPVSS